MDKKRQNRRFEEKVCSSSSASDTNFISDYFAWSIYKVKLKQKVYVALQQCSYRNGEIAVE